jgi:hypothetical protein
MVTYILAREAPSPANHGERRVIIIFIRLHLDTSKIIYAAPRNFLELFPVMMKMFLTDLAGTVTSLCGLEAFCQRGKVAICQNVKRTVLTAS